jgi:hypothetical protein
VWPSAKVGSDEEQEMPVFSGTRNMALIHAFGPSCGLGPLAEIRKANIYAEVFDMRSGQEAFAQIGLRLGGLDEEMKSRN